MITEVFASMVLLIVSVILILIPGVLLSLLLIKDKYRADYFWIFSLFLGISFIIIILQTITYLNIPLSISSFLFLMFVAAGIILIYLKKKPLSLPNPPLILLLLAVTVIAANGLGFFTLGPSNYLGYGWIDQHNYVGISQFLIDYPFNTGLDQIEDTPYLVDAILKKDDRIGQSVLQGFVAVISCVNAKTAYGAISLLSPLLTFFAVWLLSQRIIKEKWAQYGAAVSASCIPGFALIHLQDFLSQALAVPFFLISPLIIYLALNEKDWRFTAIGILIFAAIHSIYTEFSLLFIVLAVCGGLWYILQTREIHHSLQTIALIIIGGLLINIGYLSKSITIMLRGDTQNILMHIFPFSEEVEGLGYLWFGYSGPLLHFSWLIFIVNFCAVLLTLAGYFGILSAVKKQKDVVCALLLVITIFPLILICRPEPYPYQFYKLLMTISPILMLGVWVLLSDFWDSDSDHINSSGKDNTVHPVLKIFPKFLLIALLISSVLVTGYIASFSIGGGYRSAVAIDNTQEMISAYNFLENTKDKDFIVSVSHPYPLAWAAYHGRNDRIFFVNHVIGDVDLDNFNNGFFSFNNISQFPRNATKLTIGAEYPQISPDEINNNLIAIIVNPQGMEGSSGSEFNWLGKTMQLDLYWLGEQDQNITLTYLSTPGPGDPSSKRVVNISVISGKIQPPQIVETDGIKTVAVPLTLQPGLNIVEFRSINPSNASVILPQDSRELLIHVSQMKIF